MSADQDEARDFARRIVTFLDWVHPAAQVGESHPVRTLLLEHLGPGIDTSVVTREHPPYEHVNMQVALDHWSTRDGRIVDVRGVTVPPHYSGVTLGQLLGGEGLPPLRLGAPDLVDLPDGPGSTRACLRSALLLVEDDRGRFAILLRGPEGHQQPSLCVEVVGLPVEQSQQVQHELEELAVRLNVYRGHTIELGGRDGGLSLTFVTLPATTREQVVLPEAVLRRVERHTLDIARLRAGMRAAGQHLKRGILLFGPPGTGKTHTVRHLVSRLEGYTVILLSGQALHAIGSVTPLARILQPAAIVLEDVDLVAGDRSFGHGSNSVLFELLDVMDGAAADADLLFLLTTNRADLLEPALAARPGRVDVAVEIGLPDADARRRLFALYGGQVPLRLTDDDVDAVIDRTDGLTASFVKELLRRSVLEALLRDAALSEVTGADVAAALDDMLDSSQEVTRALLSGRGRQGDDDGPTVGGGSTARPPGEPGVVRGR